jgi:putative transcriptional regulator
MDVANFTHHFLIATPSMADMNFAGTVTYICEHNDTGAIGIVINRPGNLTLPDLLSRIDVEMPSTDLPIVTVQKGGPVHRDRGFVLHRLDTISDEQKRWASTLVVNDEIGLTTSRDILEALPLGEAPSAMLVTMGYAAWAPGQLEEEMGSTDWLVVKAQAEVIFDTPLEGRYEAAVKLLGIDLSQLALMAGHG